MKSADSSSMNLYSIFYIKSSFALPSLFIMKTAKKLKLLLISSYFRKSLPVRFLDATIDHLNQNVWVFTEFYHKFLTILHLSESVFVHNVSVVKEEVVF